MLNRKKISAVLYGDRRRLALVGLVSLGCSALSAGAVWGQVVVNPSQLVPAAAQPTPGASRPRLAAPVERGLQAPAGAAKVSVVVQTVVVDRGFPELRERTSALIAEIQGQRVSVERIYEFARALQQAYSAAGYPLALVTVPSQKFQSGAVRIVVIDGVVEGADVSNVPERARELVTKRLEPLFGKPHITSAELQRRLLLVGEIPRLNASNISKPGSRPGNMILTISGQDGLISASQGVDNRLSRYLGTWELTSAAQVNNALGFGEQFFGAVSSSPQFHSLADGRAKYQFYGGGVMLPIGYDGLTVTAGYNQVRILPEPLPFSFSFEIADIERVAGRYERAFVRANYPLILTLEQSLRLRASYDFIQARQRANPFPFGFALPLGQLFDFNRDRYSAIRLGPEWGFFAPTSDLVPFLPGKAKVIASIEYSHGLGGRVEGVPEDSFRRGFPLVVNGFLLFGTPLSRPGSSPDFNKLNLSARVFQPLPENFQLSLFARAQTSFGAPLVNSETLSLDGLDAVSGFAAGTLNVDRGVTVRGELSRQFNNLDLGILRASVSPYILGAWGRGVLEWPFLGEFKRTRVVSVGGGVRAETAIVGSPFGESISVEFAKDYSSNFFHREGYRTNFSFLVKL